MASDTSGDQPRAGELALDSGRGRTVLAAVILGSAVASLTSTVVNIALPTVAKALKADSSQQTLIVNAYALSLAALILVGGSLGDRYGRVRVYRIGLAMFALASLLCATAWNVESLIAFRLLQGIGGALLTPGSLAIIEATFRKSDRGRGVGLWSGIGGISNAIGPLLGGLLVAWSWRSVFLLNLPIAVGALALSRAIPESSDPAAAKHPIDTTGAVLGTISLGAISYALVIAPAQGWNATTVALVVVGLVAVVAFILHERRDSSPMLPLDLFKRRTFSVAIGITFLIYGAMGVVFFLLPVQLQVTAGWSAVASGTAMLPITFLMLVLSSRFGDLASKTGPRLLLSVGPILMGIGMLLFRRIGADATFLADVLPAVSVFGLGLSMLVAPLTSTTLEAAPETQAGAASGVSNAVSRTGSLLAVAGIPSLVGLTGTALSDATKLNPGFDTAVTVSAVIVAVSGGLAWLLLGGKSQQADPRPIKHHPCPVDGSLAASHSR